MDDSSSETPYTCLYEKDSTISSTSPLLISSLNGRYANKVLEYDTYTDGAATTMSNCKKNSFSKTLDEYNFLDGCAYKCFDEEPSLYKNNVDKTAGSFSDPMDTEAVCINDDLTSSSAGTVWCACTQRVTTDMDCTSNSTICEYNKRAQYLPMTTIADDAEGLATFIKAPLTATTCRRCIDQINKSNLPNDHLFMYFCEQTRVVTSIRYSCYYKVGGIASVTSEVAAAVRSEDFNGHLVVAMYEATDINDDDEVDSVDCSETAIETSSGCPLTCGRNGFAGDVDLTADPIIPTSSNFKYESTCINLQINEELFPKCVCLRRVNSVCSQLTSIENNDFYTSDADDLPDQYLPSAGYDDENESCRTNFSPDLEDRITNPDLVWVPLQNTDDTSLFEADSCDECAEEIFTRRTPNTGKFMCGKADNWAEAAPLYNCYYETDGSVIFDPTIFHTDYEMFDITDNILNDMDETRVNLYDNAQYEDCLNNDNTDLDNYELGCAYYCRENHALYREWGFYSPSITTKPTDVTANAVCIRYSDDPANTEEP